MMGRRVFVRKHPEPGRPVDSVQEVQREITPKIFLKIACEKFHDAAISRLVSGRCLLKVLSLLTVRSVETAF
jgi:hypothetical protein